MVDYIKAFFRAQLASMVTVELLRKWLGGLIETAKTKAEGTENPLDDAAVAALEWILADDERMGKIVTYIRAQICPGECAANYGNTEALAVGLASTDRGEGVCESSVALTVLAEVLEALIPALIAVLSGDKD